MSRDIELEQQIDAYVKGKLSEKQAQQLWVKLLQRPDYIELLETELGVKSILEKRPSAGSENAANSAKESSIIYNLQQYKTWIAAAAAVVLLVISINILKIDSSQTIEELALKNINLAENLASAQILRSQKSSIAPADSLLNRGFEAAISGDISQALEMYDKIIAEFGNKSAAIQAHLNKGIIQYNNGQFGQSIISFKAVLKKVSNKPITKEKAYWYMGNAYINIEKLKEARDAIHHTYTMDGIYRKPALRLLKKLDHKLGNVDFDNFEQQMKEDK